MLSASIGKLLRQQSSSYTRLNMFAAPLAMQQYHTSGFTLRFNNSTGKGANTHRSNKAKEGLYHGKDVRFGHKISFSHHRAKKRWSPNVQNKRLWSEALDDWVRFKVTTRALKEIDNIGGIDNYVLALDEKSVSDSNYVTKMRDIIGSALYQQGALSGKHIRKLGYDIVPPSTDSTRHQVKME